MAIVNRSLAELMLAELIGQDGAPSQVAAVWQLAGNDPRQGNTWDAPNVVTPYRLDGLKMDGAVLRLRLPPLSFTAIRLRVDRGR